MSKNPLLFSFFHKKFLKILHKPMSSGHSLTFPLKKKKLSSICFWLVNETNSSLDFGSTINQDRLQYNKVFVNKLTHEFI